MKLFPLSSLRGNTALIGIIPVIIVLVLVLVVLGGMFTLVEAGH